jgi:TldD protein
MISELTELDDLGAELARHAEAAGVMLIWRAQERSMRSVVVRDGKMENCSTSSLSGHAVHLFAEDGTSAMAARDDFQREAALELLKRTILVTRHSEQLELEKSGLPVLEPTRDRIVPKEAAAFDEIDLAQTGKRLIELEKEIAARSPGVRMRVSYRAELDGWRIMRSDGTDVLFAMPRCTLSLRATSTGNGDKHGVTTVVFEPHPGMLWDSRATDLFLQRAVRAAILARELPDAPPHPAGSFPLVIDYALAKGLAHEAFGHASEADSYRSSILARNGVFRRGEKVGADHVSIIDEPLKGDHAWQPFSSNGVVRTRAVLVDRGRLAEGLSDPWSAGPGGVRLTGAGRAELFNHPPQPRMSNIRIEAVDPLPAAGEFEEYGPSEVRDLLAAAGVFKRHPRIVYLSGYSGGQVNTATGDFVFHCKAIYGLAPSGITFHKPAILSGSMFGALKSVREAFGPLKLDAIGHCGKWGQSVPSSGGSHYFLLLDPDPTVLLGGR